MHLIIRSVKKQNQPEERKQQSVFYVLRNHFKINNALQIHEQKVRTLDSPVHGSAFEPTEENPMLGFRGASRYYNELYKEGFALECAAVKRVREEMALTNVKLMIPFCRTITEGKKVIELMAQNGLDRSQDNTLQIYMMAEIPSNVLLAEKFAKLFDGFSIGSNDLTQLTLGIDRDSAIVSSLFNEQDEAAKMMIDTMIEKAVKAGVKIGLCGQAPSDYPEFAQFLVQKGINSISFNPDALVKGMENIDRAEQMLLQEKEVMISEPLNELYEVL